MYRFFTICFLFISGISHASSFFEITEERLIHGDSPQLNLYNISVMDNELNLKEFENKFNPNINMSMYHKVDNQKALTLSGYDKPTSPINTREISVNKSFMFGGNLKLKLYQSDLSNAFVNNSDTAGAGLEIAIDLINGVWKKKTKNTYSLFLNNLKLEKSIRKYKTYLFKNNLRKTYWMIVANDLSLNVLYKLLQNTKKTLRTVQKKYQASIADKGELSRIKAQVKSTEAIIISYNYQKEQLVKNLKSTIRSDFHGKLFRLGKYNINQSIDQIKSCTKKIIKSGLVFNNSLLNQQSKYIKIIKSLQKKINHTYGNVDMQLVGSFDKIGKAHGVADSFSDLTKDGRSAYSIGFSLSIPLGTSDTKKLKVKLGELNSKSLIEINLIKMKSFHYQTVKMISLLNDAVENQVEQNRYLSVSLKSSKGKYKQARLTIEQYIAEENNLIQSNLNIIQTKLNVVLTLLDYFSVFNRTKCIFNKISIN